MSDLDNLVQAAAAEIAATTDLATLDAIRVRLLGKKGEITDQLKALGALPPEERKAAGARINVAKEAAQAALDARKAVLEEAAVAAELAAGAVDVTQPGRGRGVGGLHPVTRTRQRIEQLFREAGFAVAEGTEVVDDFHNLEALNIP